MVSRVGPGTTLDRAWAHEMAQELNNLRHLIGELSAFDQATAQRLAWSVLQYHGRIVDNAEHGRNHRDGAKEGLRFLELLPEPSQDRVGLLVETAWLHQFINDVETARALLDEASVLLGEVGRPNWKPYYLERVAAEVAAMSGSLAEAGRIVETALDEASDADSKGALLDIAAHVRFERGDIAGAAECYEAEAHLWSQIGEEAKAACAHGSLAEVLLVAGDPHGAARAQSRCLDVALQLGAQREVAYSLHLAARLATLDAAWQQAATFAIVGDEQLARIGASMYPTDRIQADRVISACQSELGDGGFDEVARQAAIRDLGEVIAEAAAFLSTYHHLTKENQHAPTTS
jgi:tetratricopeptide (TPR) repeat protein